MAISDSSARSDDGQTFAGYRLLGRSKDRGGSVRFEVAVACGRLMKDTAYSAFLKPQLFAFGFGRTLNEQTFPSDGWEILGITDRMSEGAKVFANPADCREIVDSLTPAQRRELAMALCRHRWTHVPKQIESYENWKIDFFKINEIYAAAGDCPDKSEKRLEILALSPALIALESFNKLPLEEDVEFDEFIGLPRDERVILTDGNHRAIHQARRILGGFAVIKALKVIIPDLALQHDQDPNLTVSL